MRVVVIGAGLSGLVAGRSLLDAGADVTIVDKGRSPGGRLATRRIGDATLDHGAQFFTVRTPALRHRVDGWIDRGLVDIWSHGFGSNDGHPRYIATRGMNSLAKDLAIGLDVSCSTMAFGVRSPERQSDTVGDTARWEVVIDDGTVRTADAVIITTPLPQAFALLADADIVLDDRLMRTEYDRTIALLATLDGPPSALPAPGALQTPSADVAFVADNQAKGVSASPAITMHASATWSETHWDDSLDELRAQLEDLARPWLGAASVIEADVKKWRFATPRTVWPDPCWVSADGTVVLAGDAFDGPRFEAAHNSGLAAAHAITR